MLSVVLRDVSLAGNRVDIGIADGRIVAVGNEVTAGAVELACGGREPLPGLHDHHIHLMAWAAALASVDCAHGLDALRHASPDTTGWVRGVGVKHAPDRHALDRVRDEVPVRVQHRSGAAWFLNSAALQVVEPALEGTDVERDQQGRPTGRVFRLDARLRVHFAPAFPDLGSVVARLHGYGVTGVTDATPDLEEGVAARLASTPGLNVTTLGGDRGTSKLLLHDHDLPPWDVLCARISSLHAQGRPVAVHCVTRTSLLLALAALEHVGVLVGDRIEHASVVPPGSEQRLADLGLAVVTQPSLVRLRGDDYVKEVDPADRDLLYPYRRLVDAGVKVAPSSDAPYGDADPWSTIVDASTRLSRGGTPVVATEAVEPEVALRGFLSGPGDPGGAARRVAVGEPADLCVLDGPGRAAHVVVAGMLHTAAGSSVQ